MTLLLVYWTSKRQTQRQKRLRSRCFQRGFDEFNIKNKAKNMCCKFQSIKEI
ncbi:hypothetical protein U771_27335 [Pseudomonas gorinensis]|uniref:Uncharacterized protein n=1 Tax=Pseudomonas gorinensis TaxID=3240790 RepID=A0ACA7PDY1_9PSED|nr:hypothetical protein U771_27335 [Pseudomonas sp. TKP]